jgi:hypothetical protein
LLGILRTGDSDATVDERSEEKGSDAPPKSLPIRTAAHLEVLQALVARSA